MTTQFASGRSSVLAPAVYITSGGLIQGGNNTYFFWLQCRARSGYNQPSTPFSIVIPNNSTVSIVIPGLSYTESEDWHEFLIYTSTTNDFTTARLVGTYAALQVNQVTHTTLGSNTPLSTDISQIILTQDYHLNFSSTIDVPANLPIIPVHGMRRFITSLSRTYRYSAIAIDTANADTVLIAATGRWLYSKSSNLVENPTSLTTSINGCNQDINLSDENPDLIFAVYDVTGNIGTPIRYYLKSASNTLIAKGTRITLSVRIDNKDMTDNFSGLLDVIIYGKVATSNYSLDTTNMLSAGSVVPYDHFTRNILLEDDLLADEFLLLSVTPRFSAIDVDTTITASVSLSIYPYFDSNVSSYSESNIAIGDLIFSESDNRLVVPYGLGVLRVLEGSGCINLYTFRNAVVEDLTVVVSNTVNQTVRIARTGVTTISSPTLTQPQRALFSTVGRYTTASSFSTPTTLTDGQAVQYTLTIEKNGDYNTVNPLYRDLAIRGLQNKAKLNTNKVQIIIKSGSIYKGFIITIDPTLGLITGTISDWSAGTILTETVINAYTQGLFAPVSITHLAIGAGATVPAGQVSIAYSFFYDNSSVSDISHATSEGCIATSFLPYKDTYNRALFWADSTSNIDTLKALVYPYRTNEQVRKVITNGLSYTYKQSDIRTADNLYVVQPIDNQGRWIHEFFQVDQNQTFTKAQYVKRNVQVFSSTLVLDLSIGNQDVVLTDNTIISFSNFQDGGCWLLFLQQGGTGNYTVNFTAVDWGLFGVPVLSTTVGKFDIITIISRASKLYGLYSSGFIT